MRVATSIGGGKIGSSLSSVVGQPSTALGAIQQLILEVVGILAFAVISGVSDQAANVMIALLAALWLLAIINYQKG